YAGQITDADFIAAGYVHFNGDTNWWILSGTLIYPDDPALHFYIPTGARDPLGLESMVSFDNYDLLIVQTQVRQASWATVSVVNDYRVLCPVIVTDPNQNSTSVAIDALGMVVKSAVMGKAGEGDTLADPTVRIEYDVWNWMAHGQPNFAHVFAREQHGASNPRWQESYVYSNGSGGVAMVKTQAHPGLALQVNPDGTTTEVNADPRWIGNGRTIVNNKGNPVKQYEPFFSTTYEYEGEKALRELGSTPILYYDPVGRNIRTAFPNGTIARIEFDPWLHRFFDANDTVKESQWYVDRGSPDPTNEPEPLNDPERRAAWLAARHANTPGIVHTDSLGRSIYTISDYGGGKTATVRQESDLTGRYTILYDQMQRVAASGFTGMAGTAIYSESAEKGRRWIFPNILGALVKTWDEHGRAFRIEYDNLHRLVSAFAQESGQAELLFNYVVYGDQAPDAEQLNLLGIAHQVFDQAGMIRVPGLDFQGNPTSVERVLAKDYTHNLDWSTLSTQPDYTSIQTAANPALEIDEVFTASATYDALNRPTRLALPDNTVLVPVYNEANFLASLQVQIQGQGAFSTFLQDQDYDAKGQRQFASYGNNLFTRYVYDPKTFRLTNLLTYKSGADPNTQGLQNVFYTYDPAGNITQIEDNAQQTYYFNNAVVKPEYLYEYDALYQLVQATGREHAGQTNDTIRNYSDLDYVPQLPEANDLAAVRTYTETYEYDLAGNISTVQHLFKTQAGAGSGWTRRYRYAYQDDPADRTNRLTATSNPGDPAGGPYTDTYSYNAYGNMSKMPHLASLTWNVLDQLQQVNLGGGGTAYYVYGVGGQRVRKVIERQGSLRVERIYLGAVEIYRERQGNNAPRLERYTLHISDNTGRIAQVDTKTIDTNNSDPANPLHTPLIRYQYSNHFGSAVLETDANGQVISYEEYHPYGTSAYRSARPGFDLSLKRYRFSGKERDDETGLYYFGARYYAPWLGRWTSSDPAGFVDGMNLYWYCRNNPVMLRDSSGMVAEVYIPDSPDTKAKSDASNVPHTPPPPPSSSPSSSPSSPQNGKPVEQPPEAKPGSSGASDTSSTQSVNPVEPARQGVIAYNANELRAGGGTLSSKLRTTPGGTPRDFAPGESLWGKPYNLWSGGVNWTGGVPSSVTAGSGADHAMGSPGYIMEDTSFEDLAESSARGLGHSGRFGVPHDTTPGSDFNQVWQPTSDELSVRAGMSLSTVTSSGLDTHPNPGNTVQVTREIPRIQKYGGFMAGLGIFSGFLTIYSSMGIQNPLARYVGYGAGGLDSTASASYLAGAMMLGSGMRLGTSLMTFGRIGGGIGAGVGQAVLFGNMATEEFAQQHYVAGSVYSLASFGGVLVLAGTLGATLEIAGITIEAPLIVLGGAALGLLALQYWISTKVYGLITSWFQ
ncbi:MAG TPA: RHS repeat-associated core domain-containing protein, partial [Ktedonobacteraceae bacterium]|nr:RHS repeat-associated core domain-containing protein [Ktedonobacteraceae bacterium]